ncbi:zinc finger protein 292-like [Sphaeramia orbicularis]|uniref:zinc finger protein 292-like n=1 Tax=Sphaeramia orbicularis TaxID=375764 RepID=UPI00117D791F|nr:zinc finger protein 654 [Sphaeramia orbicularis]
MADSESDLETDGLELALETLCKRHCSDESSLKSKEYCAEFCELVEEYTGQWQVPLPQLKVLRTALCSFTKATAAFPDDCQHIHYVLSSLALSFFELMLFFSKEEFGEKPLKEILDCFQECHSHLLRHRNIYLQHVKQIIKTGGPWENPVLQGILKEADLPSAEVEQYLSSELPVFLELRIRYLQACERVREAMTLSKSCLENREAGNHLFFHQAYLTCLYKASLHEHLLKEMAEIDGRDAVEIICNTESVEKDELLLTLCKAFLTQQLHNGDMYYIWDLVFIWSRLHLRAHPSRQGFLDECLQLASSATNVRAIFPFIKLVTTELGGEGVQVCVELCARALQLCDLQADSVTRSLVCKTIAFLLPHDLEVCRACALLVFCQERSLEAYRTVCLLYMHPDQDQHPHSNPVRTNVRFHILQKLKERLCFDPEFWNLLTLRTHCLELMSDKGVKAAVLSEIQEEAEKEYSEELSRNNYVNDPYAHALNPCQCSDTVQTLEEQSVDGQTAKPLGPSNNVLKRRQWRKKQRRRRESLSDEEVDFGDDPEIKYNFKSPSLVSEPVYSLRRNHSNMENSAPGKIPLSRKREYLSRCVKSQILKRKGRKKRWLQGLPRFEPVQSVKEKKVKVRGKKRGRKPLSKLELSYPDNVVYLAEESDAEDKEKAMPYLEKEPGPQSELELTEPEQTGDVEKKKLTDLVCGISPDEKTQLVVPAVEGNPELDGSPLALLDCPVEQFHNYSLNSRPLDSGTPHLPDSLTPDEFNGISEKEALELVEDKVKRTWREKVLRTQQYAHLMYHCKFCRKDYKGLNVMRHALSHLKKKKLRCIICGKRFRQLPFAKKHVMDHIDEMYKRKPSKKPCVENTPAANGRLNDVENQPSAPKEETPQPTPKIIPKSKRPSLSREDRIIRNLRTLIKKTSVLHKKCKKPDSNIFKQLDFKDDQVVIKDGLVIVKEPTVPQDGGGGSENPAGQNGFGVDITYHLCPSESCDRVFLKISTTLTKHAIRCHINEDKVLEKTFVWAKHKCTLCLRQIQFFQHYKDHMKLHMTHPQYFCYHVDCNQRFAALQELKDHVKTHEPFRPQCPFTACEKLFSSVQGLQDHEWRHYVPTPQKEELELGLNRQKKQNAEAPWKQRVKVEELWLQSKKGPRDGVNCEDDETSCYDNINIVIKAEDPSTTGGQTKTEDQECDGNVTDRSQGSVSNSDPSSEKTLTHEVDKTNINGFEDGIRNQVSHLSIKQEPHSPPALGKKPKKKLPMERDPLDVKDMDDSSTLAEGFRKKLEEPLIAEHKTFKPEDPSYATFVKAPFIRPPPSTYLDESVLSMRKRRTTEEVPQKKNIYWVHKKKKDPVSETEQKEAEVVPEQKIRHRCEKCLSSFSTADELKKHQALNTCSALFGFDSDDDN